MNIIHVFVDQNGAWRWDLLLLRPLDALTTWREEANYNTGDQVINHYISSYIIIISQLEGRKPTTTQVTTSSYIFILIGTVTF